MPTRRVAGHSFHLVAGERIDERFDRLTALPAVAIRTAAEREAAVTGAGPLRPFASLGSRFTVVVGGTVYRVDVR